MTVIPDSPDLLPLSLLNFSKDDIDECFMLLLIICTLDALDVLLELLLLGESSRLRFLSLLSRSFLSRRSFLSLFLSSDFTTGVTVMEEGIDMGMGMISMPGLFRRAALRDDV